MKRMKKVFSSNSQLAHVWAQQTQSEGRANNMFFEGNKIYSYGRHYLAAVIHTYKGKKFALVRSDAYSVSTGKHLSDIRNALQGLMPYFIVTKVEDVKEAVKQLDVKAQQTVDMELKRVKVARSSDIVYALDHIRSSFKDANELRSILGRVKIKFKPEQEKAVKNHYEKRYKRYLELNTPEMQAKKEAEREKRQASKAAKEIEKLQEDINNFRAGVSNPYSLWRLPHELLRIRHTQGYYPNTVETSRGAEVPYKDAETLYHALNSELASRIIGQSVGSFTVRAITDIPNDKVITIGCHKILLSEAKRLFEEKKEA